MRFIAKITCLFFLVLLGTTTAKAASETSVADSTARVMRSPAEGARMDRGIYQYPFLPKGEFLAGATISYAHLDSEDSQILPMVDGLQIEGSLTRISPFFGVCIAQNQVLGARLAYQAIGGMVDEAHLTQHSYAAAIFHRNYIGLDPQGRFALYNETRLEFAFGQNHFRVGNQAIDHYTKNRRLDITFHPGLAVYIMDHVSMDVSVGIGGVSLSDSRSYDGDQLLGRRTSLNTNFRINLLDISLGITVHL